VLQVIVSPNVRDITSGPTPPPPPSSPSAMYILIYNVSELVAKVTVFRALFKGMEVAGEVTLGREGISLFCLYM